MNTLKSNFGRDSAYWGERGDWLVAHVIHRDSDALTRSNWRVLLRRLGYEEEYAGIAIEHATHWAVGWVEYLLISPDCVEKIAIAEKALADLENYPVLDESDFSDEEQFEADKIWKNCYSKKARLAYVRENRSQFDFRGFSDLLGCIRGKYFAGDVRELIS